MAEFFDWITKAGGVIAVIVALLGFIFREKWKQILQRSLGEDLERLKDELAKSQAEHAASLTPQLEQIKHDFQQKLEAYKVSLIAETEAAKAKEELRKSIALRYSEIEFERLVALEKIVAPMASRILSFAMIEVQFKSTENFIEASSKLRELQIAADEVRMFIPLEESKLLISFQQHLLSITSGHIGQTKPVLASDNKIVTALMEMSIKVHSALEAKIQALGKL